MVSKVRSSIVAACAMLGSRAGFQPGGGAAARPSLKQSGEALHGHASADALLN